MPTPGAPAPGADVAGDTGTPGHPGLAPSTPSSASGPTGDASGPIDGAVPSSGHGPGDEPGTCPAIDFHIVGVGASAGGVPALQALFAGMPSTTDLGMAFVVVQHLSPDHSSFLSEIIRRSTLLEVFEAAEGMVVRSGCIYVIPPGRDIAILNGTLQLFEPTQPHGRRMAIDFFFRSLALDQRWRAIGIVLSGTGSDGTQGIRAIKAEGGLVIAQARDSTQFSGMPESAIATGVVDFELFPDDILPKLFAYAAHASRTGPAPPDVGSRQADLALSRILVLLRAQTGHDFSLYKPSTVLRRIERRKAVHQIVSTDAYARYLQQSPPEVELLFRDMLIGVTSFFRDPECFTALAGLFTVRLIAGKGPDDTIRVWAPACSTGEEAYSIAMLLQEQQDALGTGLPVFIFATDIDARAVATARTGRYTSGIALDVSPARLARFFDAEPDGSGYRVKKSIRDMLIFSEHDIIRDPPFSRLDLVACRNLLIYLGPELQNRLIPLFHYALNPGGFLFLGSSETVGDFSGLFSAIDRKLKLYQRKDDIAGSKLAVILSRTPTVQALRTPGKTQMNKAKSPVRRTWREVTEQALLRQLGPTAVLVNAQGDILYIHGRTGPYLELAPGEAATANVLKMARDGLRQKLSTALYKAVAAQAVVEARRVRVRADSRSILVDLRISPAGNGAAPPPVPAYLVTIAESPRRDAPGATAEPGVQAEQPHAAGSEHPDAANQRVEELELELRAKDEYLLAVNEAMDISNQDLKSSNEELQSVNEELQSTNEELETSKEEMQSINEELSTVNTELHARLMDLSRANSDITNLFAGTGIATVFVDMGIRVLRYTPTATTLINLIKSDVGRPIAHVATNLVGYDRLALDAQSVLDTLVPKEQEVQTATGNWYTLRIQPYRTIENMIDGCVITFVDITEKKLAEVTLKRVNETLRLAVVVRDSSDAISVNELDGRIIAWNPAAARLYGWSETEALQMNIIERIPRALRDTVMAESFELIRSRASTSHVTQRLDRSGKAITVRITASALVDDTGRMYAVATTERPLQEPGEPPASRKPR